VDEVSVLLATGHWGIWFPVFQNTAAFSSWAVDPWLWEHYTVWKVWKQILSETVSCAIPASTSNLL